jgi:bacteriorhodopsin
MLLVVSGIMAMSNLIYKWVFYIITGVTLLATLLLVFDVEEEIDIKKEKDVEYDKDNSLVELPGEPE